MFNQNSMSSPKIRLFISLCSPQSWIPHPSALQCRHPLDQRTFYYGSLFKTPFGTAVALKSKSLIHWSDLLLEASKLETSNLHTEWSSMPSLGSYIIANLRGDKPNLPTCHTQTGTQPFLWGNFVETNNVTGVATPLCSGNQTYQSSEYTRQNRWTA